jgi:hypothetical protein
MGAGRGCWMKVLRGFTDKSQAQKNRLQEPVFYSSSIKDKLMGEDNLSGAGRGNRTLN